MSFVMDFVGHEKIYESKQSSFLRCIARSVRKTTLHNEAEIVNYELLEHPSYMKNNSHVGMDVNCWSLLIAFYEMGMSLCPCQRLRQKRQAGTPMVVFLVRTPHRVKSR